MSRMYHKRLKLHTRTIHKLYVVAMWPYGPDQEKLFYKHWSKENIKSSSKYNIVFISPTCTRKSQTTFAPIGLSSCFTTPWTPKTLPSLRFTTCIPAELTQTNLLMSQHYLIVKLRRLAGSPMLLGPYYFHPAAALRRAIPDNLDTSSSFTG